jgi:hypothetical protein
MRRMRLGATRVTDWMANASRCCASAPAPARPRPRPAAPAGASAGSSASPSAPRAAGRGAAAAAGSRGASASRTANPFAGFDGRVKHWHMLMMCLGCGAAGIAAGQLVDVDENELKRNLVTPYNRDEIEALFTQAFDFRPDLAATTIRAAFADAATRAEGSGRLGAPADPFAPTSEMTGFDACRSRRNLDDVYNQVAFAKIGFPEASRADILALGSIAAVRFLKGPADKIVFRWGRKDPEDLAREAANKTAMQKFLEPNDTQDTYKCSGGNDSMRFYAPLCKVVPNLNVEEAMALMAAHAVGEFHEPVSGLSATAYNRVSRHKFYLGVHYYQLLLDLADSFKPPPPAPPPCKGEAKKPSCPVMLVASAEMKHPTTGKTITRHALASEMEVSAVLDAEGKEMATSFATDHQMWQGTFARGFTKLLDAHHQNLRPYVSKNAKDEERKAKLAALEVRGVGGNLKQ